MVALPTGTVTFLLTDVEGSIALWEGAPAAMRAALARHDALFEQVIRDHAGSPIRPSSEGDSRFAVFASAADAVAAALAIQGSFAAEPWSTPRPIKVRIGIHTGEAELRGGDYDGSAVNRCARLRGIGHGGQLLLSEATAALVRDDLPEGAVLVDLGVHRLHGLPRPERVFQLSAVDRPADFPPLASPDVRPNNLPVQTTSLVGREEEVGRIRALLHQKDVRLLTLTGPGGTGKTHLALQAAADLADRYADGVFFVDLAPIVDPSRIAATVASVLGVAESGERLLDDLKRYLQARSLLLVLDNFEQILAGAAVVVELLTASAGLKVLVTSRAVLRVRGEHQLEVPPLAVPDLAQAPTLAPSPETLGQYPAIVLFVERARAIRADFALTSENGRAVAAVCARLDGLPLALELAAARIRLLTPEAMVQRLDQRLPLMTGGARDLPARQRTLRDTVAWSYDLLEPEEQRAVRALSVFVGGSTLGAGCWMLGAGSEIGPPGTQNLESSTLDVLESLTANSLLRRVDGPDGEPRFTMLETIREFGLERLESSGEAAAIRDRHLAWYAETAERVAQEVERPATWPRWLRWLDAELDNLRAALLWSDHPSRDTEAGLRLAGVLSDFWSARGHHREARAWLARLLARSSARTIARADALEAQGYLALRQGDYAAGGTALEASLAIRRELDDRPKMIRTLRYLALVHHHLRAHDRARVLLDESLTLARALENRRGIAMTLRFVADLELDRGEHLAAAAFYEQSLALAREMGNDHGIADALRGLGNIARVRGEYGRARDLLRESLGLFAGMGDKRCTPICLEGVACMEVGADWAERAIRMLAAAQAFQETTGAPAPPAEMADHRRTEADARAQLGEERFVEVWATGAAMSLDEAVAYALADDLASTAPGAVMAAAVASVCAPVSAAQRRPAERVERAAGLPLSAREREVVALIAEGRSNREIADALVLSVRTVERHIENVYNRLGISGKAGRAIVTAYALRHGLTPGAGF